MLGRIRSAIARLVAYVRGWRAKVVIGPRRLPCRATPGLCMQEAEILLLMPPGAPSGKTPLIRLRGKTVVWLFFQLEGNRRSGTGGKRLPDLSRHRPRCKLPTISEYDVVRGPTTVDGSPIQKLCAV